MIHVVRMAGVAWVGALCFVFAYIVSRILNRLTPPLDQKKTKWRTFLEVTLQFGIIGTIVYASRLFIKAVPFPFDNTAGYIHSQLGELRSLPLMVFIFMFFQTRMQEKMKWIMN